MFLVVGGVLFWVLMALFCIAVLFCLEYEKPVWATVSLIVTFVALAWFGDFNIYHAIKAHPLLSVLCVLGYLVAGVLWSIWKWWFAMRARRDKYNEERTLFFEHHGMPTDTKVMPENLKFEWARHCDRRNYDKYRARFSKRPSAKNNKGRIITWMAYWPWSFVWTIINDPIKRFFKYAFRRLQSIYQAITDKMYKDIEKDFPTPEEGLPIINRQGDEAE